MSRAFALRRALALGLSGGQNTFAWLKILDCIHNKEVWKTLRRKAVADCRHIWLHSSISLALFGIWGYTKEVTSFQHSQIDVIVNVIIIVVNTSVIIVIVIIVSIVIVVAITINIIVINIIFIIVIVVVIIIVIFIIFIIMIIVIIVIVVFIVIILIIIIITLLHYLFFSIPSTVCIAIAKWWPRFS